jgi:L-aminopeptidase/D-esterase-like protein
VTETDGKGCCDNPLGYAEGVFGFIVMCGAIRDVAGVKMGHYSDNKGVTAYTVILGVPAAKDVNKC